MVLINTKSFEKIYISDLNHDKDLVYKKMVQTKFKKNLEITLLVENTKSHSITLERIIIYGAFMF